MFVTHDAGGTIPPLLALAAALVGRGHDVTVLSQPSAGARVEAAGGRFVPFAAIPDYDRATPIEEQIEVAFPLVAGTGPGEDLARVVDEHGAEIIVVDPNLSGALAAAETFAVPTAVLLHSMYATFVATWFADIWPLLADSVNATRAAWGLGPVTSWAALFDGHDALLSVVPAWFDAPVPNPPANLRHVGFVAAPAVAAPDPFPPGDGPRVLVGLSTTYQHQEGLLAMIVAALSEMDVRALVTTAGYGDAPASPNVKVVDFIPHAAVLPHADVMVTHAGLGSVAAAMSAGVPLVCTPIARDQPINAERVVAVGAGVNVGTTPRAEDIAIGVPPRPTLRGPSRGPRQRR